MCRQGMGKTCWCKQRRWVRQFKQEVREASLCDKARSDKPGWFSKTCWMLAKVYWSWTRLCWKVIMHNCKQRWKVHFFLFHLNISLHFLLSWRQNFFGPPSYLQTLPDLRHVRALRFKKVKSKTVIFLTRAKFLLAEWKCNETKVVEGYCRAITDSGRSGISWESGFQLVSLMCTIRRLAPDLPERYYCVRPAVTVLTGILTQHDT